MQPGGGRQIADGQYTNVIYSLIKDQKYSEVCHYFLFPFHFVTNPFIFFSKSYERFLDFDLMQIANIYSGYSLFDE